MIHDRIRKIKKTVNINFTALILLLVTIFLSTEAPAQNVDSLIEVINHSGSYQAIEGAKDKIPAYLRKVDLHLLDVTRKLKAEGITRFNAPKNNVGKKFSTPQLEVNNQANFLVNIYLKELNEEVISKLNELEGIVRYIGKKYNNVTCWLPFDAINTIAKDSNVQSICTVPKPHFNSEPYKTAGDQILSAVTARSSFGINGEGIKVGIISDDADNYQVVIDAGYLNGSLFHYTYDDPWKIGNEGTAMSEIVHVLAPKADIYFAALRHSDNFIYHIRYLKDFGCKIIVDDVGFADEPMFEDWEGAWEIDDATADGVIYISSAGNAANRTWNGMSADANQNKWMEFSGTDETNAITVPGNGLIKVILQWANKWDNAHDDFNIYLYAGPEPSSEVLVSGTNFQGGGLPPQEFISWINPSASPQTVYPRIKLHNVSASRELTMEVWDVPGPLSHVQGGRIWGHPAANSCISVGAINSSDGQTIENFSSVGSARIYEYDENGYPVSFTERQTPTICGIDNVQTYIGNGTTLWYDPPGNFLGTSAAAPHIAAIASLILQQDGTSFNWEKVKSLLTLSADKVPGMEGQNFTNVYGFGRANAYKSCRNLYVPQVYPTIPSALSAAKSGQWVVVTSGDYTINNTLTVPSGRTLSIQPGVTLICGSGVSLVSNGKINAVGTTANPIIFTSAKASPVAGDWQGVRFINGNNGSVLKYCEIKYASNGVYVDNTDIDVKYSHIHNNSYSGILATDGADVYLQYNTINNAYYGLSCRYDASSSLGKYYVFGGNRIHNHHVGLECSYNSYMFLGKSGWLPCFNSIYSISGSYLAEAFFGSEIQAEVTWWGTSSPSRSRFLYSGYGGTIDYNPWLTSDPGYGSPLAKSGQSEQITGNEPPEIDADNPQSLYEAGDYYRWTDETDKAVEIWKQLIEHFQESEYAVKALVQLYHLSKDSKTKDFDLYLKNIRNGEKVPANLYRKAMILETYLCLSEGENDAALSLVKEMTGNRHKGTQAELYGLYTIAMSDDEGSQDALNTLKEHYPNNTLTNIAREQHYETVNWQDIDLSKPLADNEEEYFNNNNNLPEKFALYENYPNPFNPTTTIQYHLPEDVHVTITVYNINGRKIKELVNGFKQAGSYEVVFNGNGLASGVYFYKIQTGNFTETKRMLLIK